MAEKQDVSGLSSAMDMSKLPLYGSSEDQIQALRDAQQEALTSLENRYAQPNWFKVAAGFAKPQLGGFTASLGSAADAMGDWVEQQRAQQLPIAQMKAQLAQSNLLLGKNKEVSDMLAARKQAGLPLTPDFVSEITARYPDSSVAKALSAELQTQQKQQEITGNQQKLMLEAIQLKQAKGMALTPQETNFLNSLQGQLSTQPEAAKLVKPETTTALTPAERERAQSDVEGIKREIARLPSNTPADNQALLILQNELKKAQARLGGTEATTAESKPQGYYPESFPVPKLEGKPDWERNARGEAWKTNASAEEARNVNFVNQYAQLASDPIYQSMDSHYNTAISMIEQNPKMAKKVFNTLRGSGAIQNQIMSALQQGAGANLGTMSANINLPVETFQKAGFSPEEQKYADRLTHSLLVLGNSDLAMRGITPEKGQRAYFENLLTKANLNQNAETALNILHKNRVAFDENKQLYDTLVDERSKYASPDSLTPYTDVMRNSSAIKKIKEDAQKRLEKHQSDYQAMLDRQRNMKGKP